MLREMALFVEVAKARSFKRAAEALSIPTSSLSRRIAELEAAVGLRLLNRTTRAVELTEAGALYFARCREIVEAARLAHEQLGDLVERPRGRLRISTTAEFARLFLGALIAEYNRLYPDVTLELDLSPQRIDLIAQNYDLALRIGYQPDSGLISRQLGVLRTALYAAPAFLDAVGRPPSPEDLTRLATIRNHNHPNPGVWTLTDGERQVDVAVTGPVLVNDFSMMRQLALEGCGVTMLHEPITASDVRAGRLERVLPDWILRAVPFFAVTPSRLAPAKTRFFLQLLDVRLGSLLAGSRR
jgi:DNA-binding transcriptional LysR family regulator